MRQDPPRGRLHRDGLVAVVCLVAVVAFVLGFLLGRVAG
jgi:hypothetical protein